MRTLIAGCIAALPLATALNAQAAGIDITGLIEVEAQYESDYGNEESSDIVLSTVELHFDAAINDRVSGHVMFLHEDDETEPMEVDEAIVSFDLTKGWFLDGGRMYVPFGRYESNMVSDPLTLDLGETREAAFLLAYRSLGFYAGAYAYNGDTIESSTAAAGEDNIDQFGATLGYEWKNGNKYLEVGLDYINNITDSDYISAVLASVTLQKYVSGTALRATYNQNGLSLIVEYVVSGNFNASDLAFNGQGATVSAYNLEAGYGFSWGSLAIGYQATEEALGLALPESKMLFSYSKGIFENTYISFEYAVAEDYSASDTDGTTNGTGNDASSAVVQLAVEF